METGRGTEGGISIATRRARELGGYVWRSSERCMTISRALLGLGRGASAHVAGSADRAIVHGGATVLVRCVYAVWTSTCQAQGRAVFPMYPPHTLIVSVRGSDCYMV